MEPRVQVIRLSFIIPSRFIHVIACIDASFSFDDRAISGTMVHLPSQPQTAPGPFTSFSCCKVCCTLPVQAFEDSFLLFTVIAEPGDKPVTEEPLNYFTQQLQRFLLPAAMCEDPGFSILYQQVLLCLF